MSSSFNPHHELVVVRAELKGPSGVVVARLVLDTGATGTIVSPAILRAGGYDLAGAPIHVDVTTASGVETIPRLPVLQLTALGQIRTNFLVAGLALPPSVPADGLLGLDFFRGQSLTIDFRNGRITLA